MIMIRKNDMATIILHGFNNSPRDMGIYMNI